MRVRVLTVALAASYVASCLTAADGSEAVEAGKDNPACKAALYRPRSELGSDQQEPIRLGPGPHLFMDDYLVGDSKGVARRINCPARDAKIANPIISGKEDNAYQPYMTILRDEQSGKFRIWYGSYHPDKSSGIGLMESDDGIHWKRPHLTLDDPAPIQFGCSVLDDGPAYANPAARYKFAWWGWEKTPEGKTEGMEGGMKIAVSPDGLAWTPLSPHVVLFHNHDINNIFWDSLRNRYVATISYWGKDGPTWKGERRTTMQSTSKDLLHWEKPWFVVTPDDATDPPETQFYAMNGHLIRGGLWIGLVKILHDNLQAEGTPPGSFGIGHTQLAWTRDGENWVRDQTPYFEPDPTPGAWDHAHAWMDGQVPVGDEVFIYYGGYKNGHKVNRYEERQIGLIRIPRDRYVSRDANADGGTLTTPPVILQGNKLTVNACVRGELRVRLLDTAGQVIPGFDAADCKPIRGDDIALQVEWKNPLSAVKNKPVRIEFQMKDTQLYAFDLAE